jgi:hypothetical protein
MPDFCEARRSLPTSRLHRTNPAVEAGWLPVSSTIHELVLVLSDPEREAGDQVCTHTDVPSRHALDLGETAIHK